MKRAKEVIKEVPAVYKALDPQGEASGIKLVPMAPRVPGLNGKVVYLVDIGKLHADWVMRDVAGFLKERFPGVATVYWPLPRWYGEPQPELLIEVGKKADAVVLTQAD